MGSRAENIAKIQTTFNAASDSFDAPALSFWNRFGQQTINQLSLKPGDQVLDVCCGSGASAIPASVRVGPNGQVLGVDIAESLLELAHNKVRQQGLNNIEFRCGDFESLGLPSETFDAVVCVFGIFFVPDMIKAVHELWRMVRPGGQLAITSWGENVLEPGNQIFWNEVESISPDLRPKSMPWKQIADPASLKALLEAGGATGIEIFTEVGTHQLASPDDWWTVVLGGGYRGIVDQLDPLARKTIQQKNLQFLRDNEIHSLDVDVLYAIAQKST